MCIRDSHGIELIAKIPFDTRVTEAQVQGVSIVEYTDDARLVGPIEGAWKSVAARMSVA